jgi:hypothetical protein
MMFGNDGGIYFAANKAILEQLEVSQQEIQDIM